MPAVERITVEVPSDLVATLRSRVDSGRYANESEAVTEALRLAEDGDRKLEAWLRETVAPICDSVEAGTATLLTLEEARAQLQAKR